MEATLHLGGAEYPLFVPGVVGRQQLLAPAAGVALAHALGVSVEDALEGLASYVPPPGRGRILRGMKRAIVLDDSYNASPAAVLEALAGLSALRAPRKVAVLGDMLELGRYSVEEHENVGKQAAASADVLVAIGIRSRAMADAALAAGMDAARIHRFESSQAAAEALPGLVEEGDAVLVKASQGIRAERIVAALLADPEDRAQLVRQDREWRKR
jgi:UDP-N-acetylmuramyl pentapeptide synthase